MRVSIAYWSDTQALESDYLGSYLSSTIYHLYDLGQIV